MIQWTLALLTVCLAVGSAADRGVKRTLLFFWGTGMTLGALYLSLNAEVLAVLQWTLSTSMTGGLVFFALIFGEKEATGGKKTLQEQAKIFLSILLAGVFCGFLAIAFFEARTHEVLALPRMGNWSSQSSHPQEGGLVSLGKQLSENNGVSLFVLAVSVLISLIGAGIISRADTESEESEPHTKEQSP